MKKIAFILFSFLIINTGFVKFGSVDMNSKIKAVFIYNFTKYIEWPKAYRQGNFVIGMMGDSPLYEELIKMAKVKKVANQSLQILKFNDVEEIKKCQILFISKTKSEELRSVIKKVKTNSTLIVTENEGLVDEGAGINFVVKDNRQKFELNKANVESHKLKISSTLEALAVEVKK